MCIHVRTHGHYFIFQVYIPERVFSCKFGAEFLLLAQADSVSFRLLVERPFSPYICRSLYVSLKARILPIRSLLFFLLSDFPQKKVKRKTDL